MGCEACRQREPEASFPLGKNPELNPDEKEQFLTTFEAYLPSFGQHYNSELDSLLSQNVLDYIKQNPLQVKPEYYRDLEGYDIQPIEFKNGNIFEGGWNKNIKMEGRGKYYLKKENIFVEGIWKEGNLLYARIFILNDDAFDIYEGEIKDSNFNGKGKLILASGQEYEGDFVNGEKTGTGKIIFEDGTIYEGQIEKGALNGEGKMVWKNGYEYDGHFNANKLEGYGKLKCPNEDVYEGDFSNNLFHGNGTYTYQNGNIYKGQFSYGAKKGRGVFTCLYKYEYDGDWDNDLPSGVGKLITWDKKGIIKSSWRAGKIMELPLYEKGTKDDFEGIDFNFLVDTIAVNVKTLTNLDNAQVVQTTQYKLATGASFLDE